MMTLAKAQTIANKAIEHAEILNLKISVCVVDSNGRVVVTKKMDGALGVSPEFAFLKAYTSGTLGMPTNKLSEYSSDSKPYYGLEMMEGGKFTTISGGLPIMSDDNLEGGVGVGGSYDVAQDLECAEKAIS